MRVVIAAVITGVLAVDMAALHDVAVGEPDLRFELLVLALSALLFGSLIVRAHRRGGDGAV